MLGSPRVRVFVPVRIVQHFLDLGQRDATLGVVLAQVLAVALGPYDGLVDPHVTVYTRCATESTHGAP